MQKNYPKFNYFCFLIFVFFTAFSIRGNAQCSITGLTVNSSTFNPNPCATATLSGCSIVYIGDGVNPTTLVMNQNLDLTCLGAIQFIIRNNASIDFSNGNYDLKLAANSSIIVENGGNISAGSNCSASDLIRIGGVKVASCNGQGGAIFDFPNLVSGGGYNTVKTTLTPSSICGSGIFTIAESVVPTPTAQTTYNWYLAASGGTAFATQTSNVSPFSSTYTTGTLSSTTTYYVSATTGSNTTPRKPVTLTVNALPAAPTITAGSTTTFCTGGSVALTSSAGVSYLWSTGETTASINVTTAGSYTVQVTNASGCQSAASAATIVTVSATNTWKGLTDVWNDPNNWSCGVPTETSNLINVIPSGVSFYPNLVSDIYLKNLTINNGALLNVINNGLTITEVLTLNGKIDLNGESQLLQDMGSVLDAASTGSIEIDQQGTGNSYRYNYWSSPVNSRGTKFTIGEVLKDGTDPTQPNINGPIDFGAAYNWADGAVTSPIKLSTYWMYVLRNSGFGYSAWFRVGNTKEVSVGEGYTMKGTGAPGSADQNYVFEGKPNNGDITLTLDAGFDYLVGNPYPSALDAWQFLSDNGISLGNGSTSSTASITGEIYFWEHYGGDTHNLAGYQGGYATINYSGGTSAASSPPIAGISNLGTSVKGAPGRYIPVGQAFFVVGDADGGQIQFNNGQRVFVKESQKDINNNPFSVFMKSNNTKSKIANSTLEDLRPKFRIGFDAPKISHRQLLLTIDERASKVVDWGFDAEIYEVFADDMYWMLNSKKYVIQGTNAVGLNSEVPLGIQVSKTGFVTVKIDALENVDDDTTIYLKDKITGESFNIREKPVQLNLVAGKYLDRFALIFKTQKLVEEDVVAEISIPAVSPPIIKGIHVFMNNALGELQIKNNSSNEILRVALINSLGQTVKTWNSNFNIRTISLPISTATGVYNVQIITKNGSTVKKVMVE